MLKRGLTIVLTGLFFLSNVALIHSTETNFWEDRRAQAQSQHVAALPSALNPAHLNNPKDLLNQMPELKSVISGSREKYSLPDSIANTVDAISPQVGTIKDIFYRENTPLVFLIQDIHLNVEAQNNIAGIFEDLHNLNTEDFVIGVEGAFDPFNFAPFRSFKNTQMKKVVSDYFLETERIAAPTFSGINMQRDPPLFVGIDDPVHYKANMDAYLNSLNNKDELLKKIDVEDRSLRQTIRTTFNPTLYKFEQIKNAFHRGDMKLGPYVSKLFDYSNGQDQELVLEQFHSAYLLEKSLDFKRVERHRSQIIEKLAPQLNEADLKKLMATSVAFKMGRLSYAEYYRAITKFLKDSGMNLREYPEFQRYVQYVLLSDGLKPGKILKAVKRLQNHITQSLIQTPQEQKLIDQYHHLNLTKKLIAFELTPDEWEEYKSMPRRRNAAMLRKNGAATQHPSIAESYERFYEEADIRSIKLIENLEPHVKGNVAAILVGGFHTPHLTQLLRDNNFSYAVVQPKITKINGLKGSEYLSIFSREKATLDQLFEGKKLFLAPATTAVGTPRLPGKLLQSVMNRLELLKNITRRDVQNSIDEEQGQGLKPGSIFKNMNVFVAAVWETVALWLGSWGVKNLIGMIGMSDPTGVLIAIMILGAIGFSLIHQDFRENPTWDKFLQRFVGGLVIIAPLLFPMMNPFGIDGLFMSGGIHFIWNGLSLVIPWLRELSVSSSSNIILPTNTGRIVPTDRFASQIGEGTFARYQSILRHKNAKKINKALSDDNGDISKSVKLAVRMKTMVLSKDNSSTPEDIIEELNIFLDDLVEAEKRYALFDTVGTEYEVMRKYPWSRSEVHTARSLWKNVLKGEFGNDEHIEYAIFPTHSWFVQEEIRKMMRPLGFIPADHPWASRHVNVLHNDHYQQLQGFKLISKFVMFVDVLLNVTQGRLDYFVTRPWLIIDPSKRGSGNIFQVNAIEGKKKLRDQSQTPKRMEFRATDDTGENTIQLMHMIHGLTQQAVRSAWGFVEAERNGDDLNEIQTTQLEYRIALVLDQFVSELNALIESSPDATDAMAHDWFGMMNIDLHQTLKALKSGQENEEFREAVNKLVQKILDQIETEILDHVDELSETPVPAEEIRDIPIIRALMEEMETNEEVLVSARSSYITPLIRNYVPEYISHISQISSQINIDSRFINMLNDSRFRPENIEIPQRIIESRVRDSFTETFRPEIISKLREWYITPDLINRIIIPEPTFKLLKINFKNFFLMFGSLPNQRPWGFFGVLTIVGTLTASTALFVHEIISLSTGINTSFVGTIVGLIFIALAQFYGFFLRRIRSGDFVSRPRTDLELEERVRQRFPDVTGPIDVVNEMTELSLRDFEENIIPTLNLSESQADRVRDQFVSAGYYYDSDNGKRVFVNSQMSEGDETSSPNFTRNIRFNNNALYIGGIDRLFVLRTAAQSPDFQLGVVLAHEKGKKLFFNGRIQSAIDFIRNRFSSLKDLMDTVEIVAAEIYGKAMEALFLLTSLLVPLSFQVIMTFDALFFPFYLPILSVFQRVFWRTRVLTLNGIAMRFFRDGRMRFSPSRRVIARILNKDPNSPEVEQVLRNKPDEFGGESDMYIRLGIAQNESENKWLRKKFEQFKNGFWFLRGWRFRQIKKKLGATERDAGIAGDDSAGSTRSRHLEFHNEGKFDEVLQTIATELGIEDRLPNGDIDFRTFLEANRNEFSNGQTNMRIEADGVLVIIDSRFNKDHAGRGRRLALASSESKAQHELAELRAWRDYAIQNGIATQTDWNQGRLGEKIRAWVNTQSPQTVNELGRAFHQIGLQAENQDVIIASDDDQADIQNNKNKINWRAFVEMILGIENIDQPKSYLLPENIKEDRAYGTFINPADRPYKMAVIPEQYENLMAIPNIQDLLNQYEVELVVVHEIQLPQRNWRENLIKIASENQELRIVLLLSITFVSTLSSSNILITMGALILLLREMLRDTIKKLRNISWSEIRDRVVQSVKTYFDRLIFMVLSFFNFREPVKDPFIISPIILKTMDVNKVDNLKPLENKRLVTVSNTISGLKKSPLTNPRFYVWAISIALAVFFSPMVLIMFQIGAIYLNRILGLFNLSFDFGPGIFTGDGSGSGVQEKNPGNQGQDEFDPNIYSDSEIDALTQQLTELNSFQWGALILIAASLIAIGIIYFMRWRKQRRLDAQKGIIGRQVINGVTFIFHDDGRVRANARLTGDRLAFLFGFQGDQDRIDRIDVLVKQLRNPFRFRRRAIYDELNKLAGLKSGFRRQKGKDRLDLRMTPENASLLVFGERHTEFEENFQDWKQKFETANEKDKRALINSFRKQVTRAPVQRPVLATQPASVLDPIFWLIDVYIPLLTTDDGQPTTFYKYVYKPYTIFVAPLWETWVVLEFLAPGIGLGYALAIFIGTHLITQWISRAVVRFMELKDPVTDQNSDLSWFGFVFQKNDIFMAGYYLIPAMIMSLSYVLPGLPLPFAIAVAFHAVFNVMDGKMRNPQAAFKMVEIGGETKTSLVPTLLIPLSMAMMISIFLPLYSFAIDPTYLSFLYKSGVGRFILYSTITLFGFQALRIVRYTHFMQNALQEEAIIQSSWFAKTRNPAYAIYHQMALLLFVLNPTAIQAAAGLMWWGLTYVTALDEERRFLAEDGELTVEQRDEYREYQARVNRFPAYSYFILGGLAVLIVGSLVDPFWLMKAISLIGTLLIAVGTITSNFSFSKIFGSQDIYFTPGQQRIINSIQQRNQIILEELIPQSTPVGIDMDNRGRSVVDSMARHLENNPDDVARTLAIFDLVFNNADSTITTTSEIAGSSSFVHMIGDNKEASQIVQEIRESQSGNGVDFIVVADGMPQEEINQLNQQYRAEFFVFLRRSDLSMDHLNELATQIKLNIEKIDVLMDANFEPNPAILSVLKDLEKSDLVRFFLRVPGSTSLLLPITVQKLTEMIDFRDKVDEFIATQA